ncbi:MMPL family transporter [Plantactinospora solaniradicis]|uniref:MMPL family transporter n=1 Tax=Plantactinospora solaniradicis TaxID=1723736 RepID=A0ABW1KC58_9ACTN
MFDRLARLVVHNPWKVVFVWLVLTTATVALAPTLDEQTEAKPAGLLSEHYESTRAAAVAAAKFPPSADSTATIVLSRVDGGPFTTTDRTHVDDLTRRIVAGGIDHVTGVTGPPTISTNQRVQMVTVGLTGPAEDHAQLDTVPRLRDTVRTTLAGTTLTAAVTGDAAMFVDNASAFEAGLLVAGVVSIARLLPDQLIIYRSPVGALLPVAVVGMVGALATSIAAWIVRALDLPANPSLAIIMTIVLYIVATNHILFLWFRYRERLRAGDEPRTALVTAAVRVGRIVPPSTAALAILFAALPLTGYDAASSLAPGIVAAVAVMAAASLTLVPAVMSLLGTKLFWPSRSWQPNPTGGMHERLRRYRWLAWASRPRTRPPSTWSTRLRQRMPWLTKLRRKPGDGGFHQAGRFTSRRPAVVAAASTGLLAVLAFGLLGMRPDYNPTRHLPSGTEWARGLDTVQAGFSADALNPVTVYVTAAADQPLNPAALRRYADRLATVPGISGNLPADPDPDAGPVELSQDGTAARINLLLESAPYAPQSLNLVGGELRDTAHTAAPPGTTALVGGVSATFADIRHANHRNLWFVLPAAGILAALAVALLLRNLTAALYVAVATALAAAGTLGMTTYVFQHIGGHPGLSFLLPLIVFLFVVTTGTDYTILTLSRLREETRLGRDPRTAAHHTIAQAGPAIGAAGLLLTGFFAATVLAGGLLAQMGLAIAIGIIICAFVTSMFLVPSLAVLVATRPAPLRSWLRGRGRVGT